MIWRFLLFLLIAAIILRFVIRYIMPVFQLSRTVHQQVNDMKKQMEEMQQQGSFDRNKEKKQKKIDEEYIDFEEIK